MVMRPQGKIRNGLIAALDIGTAKICCLIARADHGHIKVIGVGHHAAKGVKAGTIIDMDACERSVLNAVHQAEQMAGETIQKIFVNLSGGAPASRTLTYETPIAGREVSDADIEKVLAQSKPTAEGPERKVIHAIPVGYSIDGSRGIRDPRGMYGQRLGAHVHAVTMNLGAIRTLNTVINRCHLDVEGMAVSPYAAGLACLVEDEVQLGVTVIDMGAGTTSIGVFYDGQIVYTDCVPIGGAHVTSDIARGLSTPLIHAERLKTLHGSASSSQADEREMIDVPLVGEEHGHPNHVPRSMLTGIIQPRIEETFELVRARLEASGHDRASGNRVVLTGGASQLPGIRELAQMILDKQVRIGRPARIQGLVEAVSSSAFATSTGLLAYAVLPVTEPIRRAKPESAFSGSLFGRLGLWLKENF